MGGSPKSGTSIGTPSCFKDSYATIQGAVFFPVSNGSTVILSAVAGRILFKENLKPIQKAGIIIGLIAIIITGCGQILCSLLGI